MQTMMYIIGGYALYGALLIAYLKYKERKFQKSLSTNYQDNLHKAF